MRRRQLKRAKWLWYVIVVLACVWLGGYLRFLVQLPREVPDPNRVADGIVVLTGSSNRLFEGLELLREKKGLRLLFSGVDPANTREALKRALNEDGELFDCCVDLGWEARDTVGNAREIAAWVERNGYQSIQVVTAHHHMPRSLLEMRRLMSSVELIPHPVFPRRDGAYGFQTVVGWLQIAGEYSKYLVSLMRTRLADNWPAANERGS